jgi:hypothetical protein
MQLFMAVPMTPSAAVSDLGGRKYHRFVPICIKNRSLSSIKFIAGKKFIGGVFTAVKYLSAVSLTPVNSSSAVSLTPVINFRLFGYF